LEKNVNVIISYNFASGRQFFGGGKPASQATPDPAPVPTPSDVSPLNSQQERTSKISSMRNGLVATIGAGGPKGITGTTPDLSTATLAAGQPKKTLGA
jgi:hypothetical protein